MEFIRKTILLLIFSSFMRVGWGQDCDEGYTEIDEECYYQVDLDVLQDIIDVNESFSGEEPLEMGTQFWVDGRLQRFYLYDNQLTTLPESFGNLSSLSILGIFYNQERTIFKSKFRVSIEITIHVVLFFLFFSC